MKTTQTIYSCLTSTFWTIRKCSQCQKFFTPSDYQAQNYQLSFKEISQVKFTSLNQAVLAGVIVQLSHKSCCSDCKTNAPALNRTREQELNKLITSYRQVGESLGKLLKPLK